MRHAILALVLVLAACGGPEPLKADAPSAQEAGPKPTATPPDPAALPAGDVRVGVINLMCGGDSFRVAFEDQRAVLVSDDGGTTELRLLPPAAGAAPGVATFTDGRVSFYKSGGGETPTIVRFARGRMAAQDCAIAQN